MKKLLAILSGVIVLLAASCGGDDDNGNDTITTQSFTGLFGIVTSHASGTTAYYSDLNYKLDLNYTDLTAVLTITGLKLPDGVSYPTLKLNDLKWSVSDNGWKIIRGSMITPNIQGVPNVPIFTDIEIRLYDRIITTDLGQAYQPGVCFDYVIDSKYSVLSSYSPQMLFGKTESENVATGSSFSTKSTWYQLSLNTDTRTVTVTMNNARFAEGMKNGLIFNLNNIPVTFVGTKAVFEIANIIPTLGKDNAPMEGFPISKLRGEMDFGGDFELQFDCTPRTAPGVYHVTANCEYGAVLDAM